jgi:hypothetical protein
LTSYVLRGLMVRDGAMRLLTMRVLGLIPRSAYLRASRGMVAIGGTTPAIPNFQDVSRISFCTVIASASEAIHRAEEKLDASSQGAPRNDRVIGHPCLRDLAA